MPAHCTEPENSQGLATVAPTPPVDFISLVWYRPLSWNPLKTGDWYTSDWDARRHNGCPTPPPASTASQTPPTPDTPGAPESWPFWQFGLGEVPVVSRRPMIEVTGPQKPTVPMLHRASRSAHGVVHWPKKTLPKPPWRPTAELREAGVIATLFDRSIGAFCSIWNQAVRPAPMLSRPRKP